jgi:radical SAM superfamily enzyme YgiQ (UPF0313 family)
MKPNILLIQPKFGPGYFSEIRQPPLGLAYIAGALREAGYDRIRILDAAFSKDQQADIDEALALDPPDIVGVSLTTPLFDTALDLSRAIKDRRPGTKVIWGGVHPTLFPGEMAGLEPVDHVVFGEGERTIVELVRFLELGRMPDGVPGVAFRNGDRVIVNPPRPLVANLDELPMPAYDLLPIGRYSSPQASHTPLGVMITSRGCPFRCIFCDSRVVLGKKYRAYSAPRMIEEWRILVRDFGVKEIVFKESDFTLDKERVQKFCELLIREPKKIPWSCNGRVGMVDQALLREMRRAGCRLIQYGVESGEQRILDTLQKEITISEIVETFRLTREAGIRTVANIMIGNPGDTRKTIAKTIALAKRLRADFANIQMCAPFPGTELHRMAVENRWILNSEARLPWTTDACTMNATEIPTPELERIFRRAYRSFYLRPATIWRRVRSLSFEDWRISLRGLRRVIGLP